MMVELTASPRYRLSFLFEASYLSSLSLVCSSSLIRLLLFPPARFFYRPYRPASCKVSFDMVIEDAIAVGKWSWCCSSATITTSFLSLISSFDYSIGFPNVGNIFLLMSILFIIIFIQTLFHLIIFISYKLFTRFRLINVTSFLK